jgi:DNA-binding transcriptional MerR regulator
MFKISEFSRLSQVSVKALRYYDELGLLKPAHVEPLTGYRYYTSEQLFQLNRILAFKDLGFTLGQIAQALDEQISAAQIRGMFRLRQAEAQAVIEREQTRLARIEARLRQIEREEEASSTQEVVLRCIKPQPVVSFQTTASLAALPLLFEEVDRYLCKHGIAAPALLPHMVLWYDSEACVDDMDAGEDTCDLEVACPIPKLIPEDGRMSVYTLPEIPLMASLMHRCQPQNSCSANGDLGTWLAQNGYAISLSQPRREVYFSSEQEAFWIAEVQIPVEQV